MHLRVRSDVAPACFIFTPPPPPRPDEFVLVCMFLAVAFFPFFIFPMISVLYYSFGCFCSFEITEVGLLNFFQQCISLDAG